MKALKYTIRDLPKGLSFLKNQKFSFLTFNKATANSLNNNAENFMKNVKRNFAEYPNNDDDDTHSDFKPKSKVEITDDNVMQMIDEWIKNNDVVLFMKGTREMPRCGFSNYSVQILKFYNIKDVKIINILENPIVREAVKKYSNWPTYPQLYVKGNLIGGCDILREMHENGSLKELVEREKIGANIVDV